MKILKILILSFGLSATACTNPKIKQSKAPVDYIKENKMDEQEFWKIINYSSSFANDDAEKRANTISQKLSEYTPEQIVEFELIFSKTLIKANDFKIMAVEKIMEGSVTDDSFLYFRCWLIAQGQKTFEQTMKNPDYLADTIEKGIDTDFENLLYVSTKAYMNTTGKKVEDDTFPRNVAFAKGLNYDFGGPKTTGTDWKEADLLKLYPKLWSKFN